MDEDTYAPGKLRAIMALYPALTLEDAVGIAELEAEYPHWEAWPHVSYPDVRLFYAVRKLTSPRPCSCGQRSQSCVRTWTSG